MTLSTKKLYAETGQTPADGLVIPKRRMRQQVGDFHNVWQSP
jgi:hypothetical protein